MCLAKLCVCRLYVIHLGVETQHSLAAGQLLCVVLWLLFGTLCDGIPEITSSFQRARPPSEIDARHFQNVASLVFEVQIVTFVRVYASGSSNLASLA